ncbi:hypothetical protein SDC9_148580 [bioreactor metagenome]|uniref:Uncharacterized protein n=1 Tax=bioreactor metagenome TaxID=1076179 RepID=A0A645EHG2_9ZZZZ
MVQPGPEKQKLQCSGGHSDHTPDDIAAFDINGNSEGKGNRNDGTAHGYPDAVN